MAEKKKSLEDIREEFESVGQEENDTDGSKTAVKGGPAFHKGEMATTSRGFSFSRLARAISEKDWNYAKKERELHEKLVDLGFKPKKSGTMVPFNADALG
ncbi:MAG: hypothetical protein K9L56_15765, partial [Clostridiales bacterium]|nr:hypothetical protein [Clostridiales bacterium]